MAILYEALSRWYLGHRVTFWFFNLKTHRDKLEKLQNRAIEIRNRVYLQGKLENLYLFSFGNNQEVTLNYLNQLKAVIKVSIRLALKMLDPCELGK